MSSSDLTPSSLLAAATDVLMRNGYARHGKTPKGWPAFSRLFEDSYGVVAVVVHETWRSVAESWKDDQGRFVDLMSKAIDRNDAKSWEGYLVLLTPSTPAGAKERQDERRIRYDTSRVRKLVATGHELKTISDVERALVSLLPLPEPEIGSHEDSILASLPPLLAEQGVPLDLAERLITAYVKQTSLLAALDPTRDAE